ncbi:PIN domain-containing protein [Hymenobacter volaticus]|uniref:PIN domain-containing protein n=1 Tax=Hymenobacter volaticus TaxID=2932254 RepID=A0ABY4G251_9BACT|nr:PIN domain-containing protein [Hymenobacter volaticus]UOQ64856.1 PIN domain-containing protein [Hymenobacter volaticus]
MPLPNDLLPTLVHKAINRKKPFDSAGQQFRDAILWHTILEDASKNTRSLLYTYHLISNDASAFGDGKAGLHPELKEEARAVSPTAITYYSNMHKFITANYSPIQHITHEWLVSNINTGEVLSRIGDRIYSKTDKIIEFNRAHGEVFTYKSESVYLTFGTFSIVSHGVYTFSNGRVAVIVDIMGSCKHSGQAYVLTFPSDLANNTLIADTLKQVTTHLSYTVDVQFELQSDGSIVLGEVGDMSLSRWD